MSAQIQFITFCMVIDLNEKILDANGNEIPLEGHPGACFKTRSGMVLAYGYSRVVVGERGPYIEFSKEDLLEGGFKIPDECLWRQTYPKAFYIEHRTVDSAFVMIYEQLKPVTYADYRVGMFYVSPSDVIMTLGEIPAWKPKSDVMEWATAPNLFKGCMHSCRC